MRTVARSLAIVSCLLLLMPQGWCCWLVPAPCCAAPHAVETEAPAKCCCCPDESETPPQEPPARPSAECCCGERDLSQQQAAEDIEAPEAAFLPVAPAVLPVPSCGLRLHQAHVLPIDPPKNVLLCVWRC